MGLVGDISPKNMTDRPILEHRADLGQSSNTRTRMDPLSEVFGSMSIQEAVYMRLEATAPWGVRYLGDTGPRIRFMLVVRGSAILPRFLHLRLEQKRSHAFQCVLDLLAAETAQPGIASSRLVSCLYESLFVYAIRAYAGNSAAPLKGWLGAMSDKHLGKAIGAMHAGIDRSWSVESLAREARMSRSAFALK